MFALILLAIYGIVYVTRWLDYWEILPNEILHHHGPLERPRAVPDYEPEVRQGDPRRLRALPVRAGRLVLHVSEEQKAIVLDNVLSSAARKRRSRS